MGILDDAIREHLELKRQHGAESDDLERLENEAFGPATRPGDPEFAEQPQADADETDEGLFEEPAASSPEASDGPDIPGWVAADEEATRIVPPPAPPAPQTAAEEARIDHPELGETADHPAPPAEPVSEEAVIPPAEPAVEVEAESSAEMPPPEPPEREIFNADDIDFGDLDLDLDEEEAAPAAAAAPPLPTEPAAEPPLPDTAFEEDAELAPELGENESSLEPGPGAVSPDPASGGAAETEEAEEDLLEETPDFLQDAPEGERLWFEQGAPKDFDFDED